MNPKSLPMPDQDRWSRYLIATWLLFILGISPDARSQEETATKPVFDEVLEMAGRPLKKYLIEWGWDMPDGRYINDHWREMDKQPFDGVVVRPTYDSWRHVIFSTERLDYERLRPFIKTMQAAKFQNVRHNFLLITMNPGNVDWFDGDWQSVKTSQCPDPMSTIEKLWRSKLHLVTIKGSIS